VKFLSEPAQIAAFTVGTKDGFIPIRTSAAEDPAVQELWAQNPALKVPYDQLEAGSSSPAAVGSVIGDYKGVRDAVRDALTAMFTQGLSPKKALARAERDATEAIQDYNERVGA
jgi:ABC-type glycerol-3-phosphate transport system substrate-binding protein